MRSGGQLVVDCLVSLGAEKAFGVPGESYLAVLDALYDTKGTLDFVLCRNEGGASFMAEAYGKLTGTPGLCLVTRGPGVTNASIGIHTAMQNSTPMLVLVGQVGTDMKGREAFQEIDYRAVFGTVAKWATEIDHAERIPEILSRAWSTALSGRPGPVVVALPEDVLAEVTEAALCRPVRIAEAAPRPGDVDETVTMLEAAERPLMVVGGGGWTDESRSRLKTFAEANDLPVLAAFRCQDYLDNHSPSYVGDAGVGMPPHVRALIEKSDLVFAVGIRFGEMVMDAWSLLDVPDPLKTLIHVAASDRELGKVYAAHLPIHAGPNAFLESIADRRLGASWAQWRAEARSAYEASFDLPPQPGPVDMGAVMRHLQERLPADAIITNGAGNFAIWPSRLFRYGSGQRLLGPQSGAMGAGVPAAIAAKVAAPERMAVCFAGDGDFQMTCQELGTAMQAGAAPIVLILNNGTYGTIRMHQERHFPTRVSGTELKNPDFSKLARAYGFHGERVERTEDFAAAFERAAASETGAVLDVAISAEALTPRQTLTEMRQAALASRTAG